MLCVFEFHLTGRKYDEKQAQEPSFWREPISAMTPRISLFPTGFSASAVWVSRLGLLPLLPVLVGHCQNDRQGHHYYTRMPRPVEPACIVVMTLAVIMLTAALLRARMLSFQLRGDGQNTPIGFKDALMQF